MDNIVHIYTDGGYSIPRGVGGWAVVVVKNGEVLETINGIREDSTSNRMEMIAFGMALHYCKPLLDKGELEKVSILTDSNYVLKGFTDWMYNWQKKGWIKNDGKPAKNSDLWKRLYSYKNYNIEVVKVKGHSGHKFNDLVDSLTRDYK